MKRNTITMAAIIIALMLILVLWSLPALAFNYTSFTNESGDTSFTENLKLTASFSQTHPMEEIQDDFIYGEWTGSDFTYLQADPYVNFKEYQAQMNEVYQHYSLFNRPDIKNMRPFQIEEGMKIWYSIYANYDDEGTAAFTYTWLDIENGESRTQNYEIPHPYYELLSYIQVDDQLHILFSLYDYSRQDTPNVELTQLTMDLTSGEIVDSNQIALGEGEIAYGLTSDPEASTHHFIQIMSEEEWNLPATSSVETADLPAERYALVNPETLEIEEIAFEDNSPNVTRWFYAEDQLYILEHLNLTADYEGPNIAHDIVIYQLNRDTMALETQYKAEDIISYAIDGSNFIHVQQLNSQTRQIEAVDLSSFDTIYQGDLVLEDDYYWNELRIIAGIL